jgi:DNA-binding NarL/FixJ family response regulator
MAGGPATQRPYQVLLVEDVAGMRAHIERAIADAGYPVRTATDFGSALAALADQHAEIIVADIVLPGSVDGLELCRAVKEGHPDCEVILVTGQASIAYAIEGIKLGACDFLLKPLEPGAVARSLSKASARIARRLAERQLISDLRARTVRQGALLDRLSVAVLLADGESRLHGSNQAAEALFSGPGALSLDPEGRLCATRSAETQSLRAAIATSCAGGNAGPFPVQLTRDADRPDLRAIVSPLATSSTSGDLPLLATVLVDLPERSAVAPNSEMLCRLYGLTPAEGQFAARLVAGDTVQEACERFGIGVATGRTHLSRIFSKTGTNRQADLIGLVLSGPALLAGGMPETDRDPR